MKNSIIVIVLLIIFVLGFFIFRQYSLNQIVAEPSETLKEQIDADKVEDITKKAREENNDFKDGIKLMQESRVGEGRLLLEQAFEKEQNLEAKSVIDLTIAESYFRENNLAKAAENLYRIGNDESYPSSTRAFALTSIMQQYSGTRSPILLEVFGDVDNLGTNYIIEGVHRQIVTLHPMGLSVAYLAHIDMEKYPEKAKEIFDQSIIKIDNDIAFQNLGEGSNYLVPNIMMAKASLMLRGERAGYSTSADVVNTYKVAITTAKEKLQNITAQFAILRYMEYLGQKPVENEVLANEALDILEKETLSTMVANSLSLEQDLKNWPGIAALVKINPKYKSYFNEHARLSQD